MLPSGAMQWRHNAQVDHLDVEITPFHTNGPESLLNTGKVTDPVPPLKHSHTKGKSKAPDPIKSSLGRFSLCDCPNTPGKTNRTGNYVKRKREWIALLPIPAVSPATSWAPWETERDAMW